MENGSMAGFGRAGETGTMTVRGIARERVGRKEINTFSSMVAVREGLFLVMTRTGA